MMPCECDRHGPGLLLGVDEVQHQRLDVAVEDQADHLGVLVDHRAARVAADDVGRADEVERRLQVSLSLRSIQRCGRSKGGLSLCSLARSYRPAKVVSKGTCLPSSS